MVEEKLARPQASALGELFLFRPRSRQALGPALNILGEPLAPSPGMSYIEFVRCARSHIGWRLRSPNL